MITQAIERIAGAICLLAVAGAAAYFAYDSHKTQLEIRSSIANSGAIEAEITDSIAAINRPCGQGKPCGLLAEANKTLVKAQDISVTLQRQVQQSSVLVNSASAAVASASRSLEKVAASASDASEAATGTIKTAGTTVAAAKPLLDALARDSNSANLAIQHTDALISSSGTRDTLSNVQATTKEFALMSNDLHVWSHPILNPDPCKTKSCTWGRIMAKVGGYIGLGAQAETFGQWWRALPVKVSK